jgi:hypothetical protein
MIREKKVKRGDKEQLDSDYSKEREQCVKRVNK